MKTHHYFKLLVSLAVVAGLALAPAGAADFAVGAPGTAAQNSTNIQNALNSALADAGPNRVLLQSGQTYVVDARLLISGAAKSVTITSDGAGKAILVGPNYTTTADSFEGVFTVQNLTNSSLGFENFTLLPPPFSTVGSGPAVGNTVGIGIADTCSGNNFHFVNMLITGNNNANGPLSTNGTGPIGGFTNPTVFGGANINAPHAAATALGNSFYLTGVVSSHVNGEAFRMTGTLDVGAVATTNTRWRAVNSTFGESIGARVVDLTGIGTVEVVGCQVVGTIPSDALRVAETLNANINGYTSAQFTNSGIELFNVRTVDVRNATLTDSFSPGVTAHRDVTMFLVDNNAGFRVLEPTVTMTDCYLGDTATLVNAIHMYFQRAVNLTRVTVKNLTFQSPTNPPILIAMWYENCQEVTLDGCLIENLQNPTLNCTAIDFTYTGLPNPSSRTDPNPTPRNFTIRNTTIRDVTLGLFPRAHYMGLIENCVFENFDGHIFSERNAFARTSANYGRRSTTIRDCTFTNINHHQLNPTQNTDTYRNAFYMLDDVVTFERVTLTGPNIPVDFVRHGLWMVDPLRATFTDCIFANWNRGAIWINNGETPNVLPDSALEAQAEFRVQNSYFFNCGHNRGVPVTDQTHANGNNTFAPIAFDQGHRFVVSNTVIDTVGGDAINMIFATGSGLTNATGTAQINDVTFVNCSDNLITVECDPDQANVVNIDGLWAVGNPALHTDPTAAALNLQMAGGTLRNINVSNWPGSVIENTHVGGTPGTYTIEDARIADVGRHAIRIGNGFDGNTVVNRADIRNVTDGSGISVQGGNLASMNDVLVVNAARYGVSVGETSPNPIAGPMRVGSLTRLALLGNQLGGIRFVQGDNTRPTMHLSNSTILNNPVGISYEHVIGQVLSVTESIIGGLSGGGGVGIDVPTVVAQTGAGSPPPRVQVGFSSLITDNVNGWGLASQAQVAPGNEAGAVQLPASVIGSDPIFISTTPGAAGFLDVDSSWFADKGVGGGPLSGYGNFIGGTVEIADWRLY